MISMIWVANQSQITFIILSFFVVVQYNFNSFQLKIEFAFYEKKK